MCILRFLSSSLSPYPLMPQLDMAPDDWDRHRVPSSPTTAIQSDDPFLPRLFRRHGSYHFSPAEPYRRGNKQLMPRVVVSPPEAKRRPKPKQEIANCKPIPTTISTTFALSSIPISPLLTLSKPQDQYSYLLPSPQKSTRIPKLTNRTLTHNPTTSHKKLFNFTETRHYSPRSLQ